MVCPSYRDFTICRIKYVYITLLKLIFTDLAKLVRISFRQYANLVGRFVKIKFREIYKSAIPENEFPRNETFKIKYKLNKYSQTSP